MRVSVEFEWQSLGQVGVTAAGRFALPSCPDKPGVYRFRTTGESTAVLIGESLSIRRRVEGDFCSDPVGAANLRIRQQLQQDLDRGSEVELSVVTTVIERVNSIEVPADLASRSVRLLVENAALEVERAAGSIIRNR